MATQTDGMTVKQLALELLRLGAAYEDTPVDVQIPGVGVFDVIGMTYSANPRITIILNVAK